MKEMRTALVEGEENSPIKATVESVLPGVHQQFSNLHHEINRVRSGITDMSDQIRQLFLDFSCEQRQEVRMTLARNFMNVAVGLVGEQGSPSTSDSPSVSVPRLPATATTTNTTGDEEMIVRPELKNRSRPKSATAVYHEYHGLGDYEGQPIVGGLAAMDTKYKNKWRLGDGGYQKAYSRIQQIAKAVTIEVEQNGKEQEAVLAELDAKFAGNEHKGLEYLRQLVAPILPLRSRNSATVGQHNSGSTG
jgi:Transcriptional activator of glycolytic enzymes